MTAPMMAGGMPPRPMGPPMGADHPEPTAPAKPAEMQTCPKCGAKFPTQPEVSENVAADRTEDLGAWLKRTGPGGPQLAHPAPTPSAGPPR